MTRLHAELLILVINTLLASTVMFIAGALKGVMNDMDIATKGV